MNLLEMKKILIFIFGVSLKKKSQFFGEEKILCRLIYRLNFFERKNSISLEKILGIEIFR